MNGSDEEKRLCRNPSGIPPLPYDDSSSGEDNGEEQSKVLLPPVSEGETSAQSSMQSAASKRDPPAAAIEKPAIIDNMSLTNQMNDDDHQGDSGDTQPRGKVPSPIPATPLLTTDEQMPRGTTRGEPPPIEQRSTRVANNIAEDRSTRRPNDVAVTTIPTITETASGEGQTDDTKTSIGEHYSAVSNGDSSTVTLPPATSAADSSTTVQSSSDNSMPPNIIKAALQTVDGVYDEDHDGETSTASELIEVSEQQQQQQQQQTTQVSAAAAASSEDEKKSEEKNEASASSSNNNDDNNSSTQHDAAMQPVLSPTPSSDAGGGGGGPGLNETILYSSRTRQPGNHYAFAAAPPLHEPEATTTSVVLPRATNSMMQPQQQQQQLHQPPLSEAQFQHMQAIPYGYAVSSPYITASQQQHHHHPHVPPPPLAAGAGGRRKITLRLQQDVQQPSSSFASHVRRPSFFFRQRSATTVTTAPSDSSMVGATSAANSNSMGGTTSIRGMDKGSLSVSWFEGTTSAELQEHVRKSLIRKMGLKGNIKLVDLRIIDETMDPPEEIVLSPYIPDGSHFLLRFSTKEKEALDSTKNFASRYLDNQIASTAPDSPSAAPSPRPSTTNLLNLNEDQLAVLSAKLSGLNESGPKNGKSENVAAVELHEALNGDSDSFVPLKRVSKSADDGSRASTDFNEEEVMSMHPEDQIEARLRQLTDLLVSERRGKRERGDSLRRQEKKQVIFVMANYFVLFLSLIAIMAEIQSRAPRWLEWAERNLESVQSCATDQESLFKCVSNGDFSGLIASFILWFGRSAATRRFFLFGFETPKRLWTVVYEAMVTAFCWGISYMFIRRGMNPDTRQNFITKYWKDAVYGSLAGFNASFLKAVLKNLIPQEALEDALQERHIKILSWLPSFH